MEKKIKSKIEKLERVKPMSLMGMMGEVAPQWVAKELNKIIDHLNSQDQEGQTRVRIYKDWQTPKGWVDEATKVEVEDTPEEITAEQLCEDNRKRTERLINKEMEERGFIRKIKDTPEEWKEVNKDIWYMVGGKKYVNINGEEYVRTSDIEKLLSKLTTK